MSHYYVLDANGEPVSVPDVLTWARWFEKAGDKARIVKQSERGDVQVSTVFLGSDHNWGRGSSPVLWETMIFGGEHDQFQERYTSRADAIAGHEAACQLAFPDATGDRP